MSDYLSEEEQLARLRGWWESYGMALLAGVVLVVVSILGWRWYESSVEERVLQTSDLYIEFQQAGGDTRDALAGQILEQGDGTAYPTFVRMQQAAEAVAAGNVADAEPLLAAAVESATGEELADTARLRLAEVHFQLDRPDAALAVLGAISSPGFRSLAAELKGDIHLARDERTLAHQSYTAAMSYVEAGDQRPVLEMKIADTADASDS